MPFLTNWFRNLIASESPQTKDFNLVDPSSPNDEIRILCASLTPGDETSTDSVVSVYWKESQQKVLEKKFSSMTEAEDLFAKVTTDLAAAEQATDRKDLSTAKDMIAAFIQTYAKVTDPLVNATPPQYTATNASQKKASIDITKSIVGQTAYDYVLNLASQVFKTEGKALSAERLFEAMKEDLHSYQIELKDAQELLDITKRKLFAKKRSLSKAAKVVMQNIFFSTPEEAVKYQEDLKSKLGESEKASESPMGESAEHPMDGPGTGDEGTFEHDELAPPSVSYDNLEKGKLEKEKNLEKRIETEVSDQIQSALEKKIATIFTNKDKMLVDAMRGVGRTWEEIRDYMVKSLKYEKDDVAAFLDQYKAVGEDLVTPDEQAVPKPPMPPIETVSPETHEKLLQEVKDNLDEKPKEDVEEIEEISKQDTSEIHKVALEPLETPPVPPMAETPAAPPMGMEEPVSTEEPTVNVEVEMEPGDYVYVRGDYKDPTDGTDSGFKGKFVSEFDFKGDPYAVIETEQGDLEEVPMSRVVKASQFEKIQRLDTLASIKTQFDRVVKLADELELPMPEKGPMDHRQIDVAEVTQAYSGKPGCSCGCNGTYWYAPGVPHEDWQSTSSDANALRNIKRVVDMINTAPKLDFDEWPEFISATVNGRVYTAYGKKHDQKSSSQNIKESASNLEVIDTFMNDSFPKDKRTNWGSTNIRINKEPNGWSLIHYQTPILYRNNSGKLYFNTDHYSRTTTVLQNRIKDRIGDFIETNDAGIKTFIMDDTGHDKEVSQKQTTFLGIPKDFPVKPLKSGDKAKDKMTCGTCGRSWDDAISTEWTPVPSGRCPFEYFHDTTEASQKQAAKVKDYEKRLEQYKRDRQESPKCALCEHPKIVHSWDNDLTGECEQCILDKNDTHRYKPMAEKQADQVCYDCQTSPKLECPKCKGTGRIKEFKLPSKESGGFLEKTDTCQCEHKIESHPGTRCARPDCACKEYRSENSPEFLNEESSLRRKADPVDPTVPTPPVESIPEEKVNPTKFKELKIAPKDVKRETAAPAPEQLADMIRAFEKERQQLSIIKSLIDQATVKFQEQIQNIEDSTEKTQHQKAFQDNLEKIHAMMKAADQTLVKYEDQLYFMKEEEKTIPVKWSTAEQLKYVLENFPEAQKKLDNALNGAQRWATKELSREVTQFPEIPHKKMSKLDAKAEDPISLLKSIYDNLASAVKLLLGKAPKSPKDLMLQE